jgi:hypothetical protein
MPRPPFEPSEENRRTVKMLAAVGMPHEHIARKLGLGSAKTLRKHFREELDLGAAEANAQVARSLFEMATSGMNVAAAIFWLTARAGWRNRPTERESHAPPPFIVARQETS